MKAVDDLLHHTATVLDLFGTRLIKRDLRGQSRRSNAENVVNGRQQIRHRDRYLLAEQALEYPCWSSV